VSTWTAGVIAASGFIGYDLSQTAANQVRNVNIHGYKFASAGGTGINDHIIGKTFLLSTGNVKDYNTGGTAGNQSTLPTIVVDNEQDWYDVNGNLLYRFTLDGNGVFWSPSDAQGVLVKKCGLTTLQNCRFVTADQNLVYQWGFGNDSAGNGVIADQKNNVTRMVMPQDALATVATAGIFRYTNTECPAGWLNNAGLANLLFCKNASDQITFNSVVMADGVHANTLTVASGTLTLGTSSITSLTCATAVNTVVTGMLATDKVLLSFNAAPSGAYLTGLTLLPPDVAGGSFNVRVCNPTAGNLTPPAATLNWSIPR
jgi:hypothetical protein